ncbi:MAG: hypothetical protein JST83_18390 [Bacteroidetes bacterium]|nr:hypothetical protein [Bacteroidota bacterium]
MKKQTRPTDPFQLAKEIVAIATGQKEDTISPIKKNEAAVALGRLGGLKGGKARAEKLTPAKRSAIAKKAAKARWNKK